MRVSVVIATANRARSLAVTLRALEQQTHREFEVIVVKGPCEDDTDAVLTARRGQIRVAENPERNLCKSRNIGIDLAAGEIVAFIDDDGIPEPRWLEQLLEPYADPQVGGAGGLVYDQTGVQLQYRYAVCDRLGRTDFGRRPPFDDFNRPGADPCVYLQGTNMSFRRQALEAIGGFDENIAYIWDEVDVALHLVDAGWKLAPIAGAAVHHKLLPSHMRRERGQVTDPYTPVKDRAYFALRNGPGHRSMEEVFRSLTDYADQLRELAANAELHGKFSETEARRFVERLSEGFEAGTALGTQSERAGRRLAPAQPEAFTPYAVRAPEGQRLAVCFVSLDYPPMPMGGIARYTVDLAQGLAAAGHEVHVVTRSDPPFRVDFEDGVWVHRHPEGERHLPHLDLHPLRDNLAHVAAVWHAVRHVHERFPLDVVVGNVWLAETLICALDPRWPVVMVCSTPMRTIADTQPAVAAKAVTDWQVALEDAAMVRAQQLMPLSNANLETVRRTTPAAADVPARVVWLGMRDRAAELVPPPANRVTEILFVGRLEPRKGVDTLLDAAIDLLRERPRVRLRLAGADNPYASDDSRPYAQRIDERLADEPELRSRIVFEGEVSDETLDELLQRCDIFCAPSRYESFGLMNVEAMMFSRPVVSTATGGIVEVVADGETGLLVEVEDAPALREALRTLVDDPALRERMGVAGRKRFEQEFALAPAVERTLDLLRTTVGRDPGANSSAREADATAEEALVSVLRGFDGVDDAPSAVAELLDPSAFPHDYRAAFARLAHASDGDFVVGMYEAILRRPPEPGAVENAAARLESGAISREELTHELATSDEARLLGVNPTFVEALAPGTARGVERELERRVRDAFWRDDATFARLLVDALAGQDGDPDLVAEVQRDLANKRDRRSVLRQLTALDEVQRRFPGASRLADLTFLTREELGQELAAASTHDDAEFVAFAYRLLLDRDPDPAAASAVARLQQVSRRSVLVDIALSPEAAGRGVDAVVVDEVAQTIPELCTTPQDGRGRLPAALSPGRLAKRILRDPRTASIERALSALQEASGARPERLAAEIEDRQRLFMRAQTSQAHAIERLERQLGALGEELAKSRSDTKRSLEELASSGSDMRQVLEAISARLDGIPAEGTHGTYLGDGKVLVNTIWGGKLIMPAEDRSLTPDLVAHGVYEAPFTRYLLRTLHEGQRVVDVGANVGMHTVLMAACVGDEGCVFAYEPNPEVRDFLEENITLNWIRNRVVVRPTALADINGDMTLHVTERYMGNSSLLPLGESYERTVPTDRLHELEVPVERLDAHAGELGRIALVKIDVEGGELRVLNGMSGLLEDGLVDIVTFEVFRERMAEDWDDFGTLLRRCASDGWRFHDISDEGVLQPTDLEVILQVGRYAQVVMTRD